MDLRQGNPQRLTFRPEGRRTFVPTHLPLKRAWRWCIAASLRDLRVSVRRGRVISLPGLRRLFLRRWAMVCWANEIGSDSPTAIAAREIAMTALRRRYPTEVQQRQARRILPISPQTH